MHIKNVKPFLSDKGAQTSKITLINNYKVVSDDTLISEIFNKFFKCAVKTLGIKENDDSLKSSLSEDPVDNALEKYENHPSILTIRQIIINESPNFYFSKVELEEIEIEIKKLN